MPTISTSSPTLTMPVSTRPVTTVPRPEIENTSSIGIRNGLSSGRSGCGIQLVDGCHQLEDRFLADFRVLVLERGKRRTRDDRNIVAVEVALGKLLADFQLDQLEQLGIVDLVDLVQVDDHGRNADLLGEQDVLLGLRHRAVGGRHDQDRAVHLRGAGDHVLHIIGVARAIDVRIVARWRSHTRRARSKW